MSLTARISSVMDITQMQKSRVSRLHKPSHLWAWHQLLRHRTWNATANTQLLHLRNQNCCNKHNWNEKLLPNYRRAKFGSICSILRPPSPDSKKCPDMPIDITFQCIYGFGMLRPRINGLFNQFWSEDKIACQGGVGGLKTCGYFNSESMLY